MLDYSFCESVTATSRSPWCVRILTLEGSKPTGGVDTSSLCGRVKSPLGWDVLVTFSATHPHICQHCQALLKGYND